MNGSKLIIEMMERNFVKDQICIKQRRHMVDTYPKHFYGFWFKLTKGSRSVNSMDWVRESRSWPSRSVLLLVPLLDEAVLPTPLSMFKAFNLSDMSMTKIWCWKDFTRSTRHATREKWLKICQDGTFLNQALPAEIRAPSSLSHNSSIVSQSMFMLLAPDLAPGLLFHSQFPVFIWGRILSSTTNLYISSMVGFFDISASYGSLYSSVTGSGLIMFGSKVGAWFKVHL